MIKRFNTLLIGSLAFLLGTSTAAALTAQTVVGLKDSVTAGTSRGDLGKDAGTLLMGFHNSHWRGLGDTGSACEVHGFRALLQDQDASTQESFGWVVRSGSDANGPAAGPSGVLHQYGPFQMPTVAAGGARAWTMTVTLAKPADIPCEDHFSVGVELGAAPQWPSDGASCHMSLGTTSDQHVNAHDMAWQITGGTVSHPSGKRAWAQSLIVDVPTLQMSINAKKSIGGMFPRSGHIIYAGNATGGEPNASALLFLDIDTMPTGLPIFGATARLHLGFVFLNLLSIGTFDVHGNVYLPLGHMPSRCPKQRLWLQLYSCGKREYLTNAQATTVDQ